MELNETQILNLYTRNIFADSKECATENAAFARFKRGECRYICVNDKLYPSNMTLSAAQRREIAPVIFQGFNDEIMRVDAIYDASKIDRLNNENREYVLKKLRPATKKELTALSHGVSPFNRFSRL